VRESRFALVTGGRPAATIVLAALPTPAAHLAALELRHHVHRLTGVVLPVRCDSATGPVILVGESSATRALGLRNQDFSPQEYLVRIEPDRVVLLGRDTRDFAAAPAEVGRDTNFSDPSSLRTAVQFSAATAAPPLSPADLPDALTLPGPYDDQGTAYAVYDFLERHCGIRWFGPGDALASVPACTPELSVALGEQRRAPVFKFRLGTPTWDWPIMKAQWANPTSAAVALYQRRLRVGGERWAANHSFSSYPERFQSRCPAFFAQDEAGARDTRQLCYSSPALVAQVAQDAREYFDGRGLHGQQVALGDYFAVVPFDNNSWCRCDFCRPLLDRDRANTRGTHFNSGLATHYWFSFVNAVAREVRRTHPGKWVATLAYHVYAFRPTEFALEPNVAVAPCLQVRNYWAPAIRRHEAEFYRTWVDARDRPIHLWNYYCFPEESGFLSGKWQCFPGFSSHLLADQIRDYARDGVRGVFLCGLGEQLDYYVTQKLYDDPAQDVDALLAEFFIRYFGAAAAPMARFYRVIEEAFTNPANYPPEVIASEAQQHQTPEIAWEWLGTAARMAQLGTLMDEATALASTPSERERVALWRRGVWDHMVEGRRRYLAEKKN